MATRRFEVLKPCLCCLGKQLALIRSEVANGARLGTIICTWDSNKDGVPTSAPTTDEIPCVHDLSGNGLYYFELRLETGGQASGQTGVEFIGIDFP
jgi:hypothetical protein